MAAPPPPPHPAVQMDELLEEFLLRLPPDDPGSLARAALVSRQWHRLITGPVFRRRFRELHRSPPLLGYIANLRDSIRFVPTSSFRPQHADAGLRLRDVRAVHSAHGRVLLQRSSAGQDLEVLLSVWDPVTDELRDLPHLPLTLDPFRRNWDAAVVRAVGDDGDGDGPHFKFFKVVFVGTCLVSVRSRNFSCLYSSEASADCWSDPIFASGAGGRGTSYFMAGTCVQIGTALYFMSGWNHEIVMYDLLTNQMSTICLGIGPGPGVAASVLIATEDGRLGVAKTSNSTLGLWLREHGGWEERRAIELRALLPPEAFADKPQVAGFAGTRAGVIFLRTHVGYFAVDLHSGRVKNVGECLGWGCIFPYMSFCTPAPGAVFKDDGPPGAGVAASINEVPGVAVAFSRDEGPRAAVVVSTDEGLGAAVVVSTDEGLETGLYQVHKKFKLQV